MKKIRDRLILFVRGKFGEKSYREIIGWSFLAVAALVGLWTIRWGISDVEGDALVTGFQMGNGKFLYRDVFSHHFPFIYFWSTAALALFGKSIYLIRASVWLFQLVVFATLMILCRYYLTIGITALIWSLLRHMYSINMLIYQSFSAVAVIGVFALTLFILLERDRSDYRHFLAIAVLSTIGILSDPLTIYPVGIALLLLWIRFPRIGFVTSLTLGGFAIVFLAYLAITGTFSEFISGAIRFNSEVYARYNSGFSSPWRFSRLGDQLWSGFGIMDKRFLNVDPFRAISTAPSDIDRWIFTGFLYRLAGLIAVLIFLFGRKFSAAVFQYTYIAAAMAIAYWGHRGASFIALSIFILSWIISQDWWPYLEGVRWGFVRHVGTVVIGAMVAWLGFRVVTFTQNNLPSKNYIATLHAFQLEVNELLDLTCEQANVQLIYYPSPVYPYFLAELEAVSGYYYMWPWVAEIGLPEVMDELRREDALVVADRRNNSLVFRQYPTREYLKPLDDFLRETYIEVEKGLYISPALDARCTAQDLSN